VIGTEVYDVEPWLSRL